MIRIPEAKIELAAKDNSVPDDVFGYNEHLSNAYFDGENLIATDGFIIAVIPVESSGCADKAGPVPVEAIRMARDRNDTMSLFENKIRVSGPTATLERPAGHNERGPYHCLSVVDSLEETMSCEEPVAIVTLDAARLLQLAASLLDKDGDTHSGLKLHIYSGHKAVIVEPHNTMTKRYYDGRFGAIMPMKEWADE